MCSWLAAIDGVRACSSRACVGAEQHSRNRAEARLPSNDGGDRVAVTQSFRSQRDATTRSRNALEPLHVSHGRTGNRVPAEPPSTNRRFTRASETEPIRASPQRRPAAPSAAPIESHAFAEMLVEFVLQSLLRPRRPLDAVWGWLSRSTKLSRVSERRTLVEWQGSRGATLERS